MSSELKCIKCDAVIPSNQVSRPSYLVKATNKKITPLPKCEPCRIEWETIVTGVEKVQS